MRFLYQKQQGDRGQGYFDVQVDDDVQEQMFVDFGLYDLGYVDGFWIVGFFQVVIVGQSVDVNEVVQEFYGLVFFVCLMDVVEGFQGGKFVVLCQDLFLYLGYVF